MLQGTPGSCVIGANRTRIQPTKTQSLGESPVTTDRAPVGALLRCGRCSDAPNLYPGGVGHGGGGSGSGVGGRGGISATKPCAVRTARSQSKGTRVLVIVRQFAINCLLPPQVSSQRNNRAVSRPLLHRLLCGKCSGRFPPPTSRHLSQAGRSLQVPDMTAPSIAHPASQPAHYGEQ